MQAPRTSPRHLRASARPRSKLKDAPETAFEAVLRDWRRSADRTQSEAETPAMLQASPV